MDLATFGSAAEASYLASIVNQPRWVGVNDAVVEGVYRNNDGNDVTSMISWLLGEPTLASKEAEDCLAALPNSYNDLACHTYVRVLCEIKVPNSSVNIKTNLVYVEPATNLFDYIGTSGGLSYLKLDVHFYSNLPANSEKKYYVSRVPKYWHQGLFLCLRHDMDYVTFDSKSEVDYFGGLIGNEVYYVGISDERTEGTFRNYNSLSAVGTSVLTWASGNPTVGAENYVALERNLARNYQWDIYAKVACERRVSKVPATKIEKSLVNEPAADKFSYRGDSGKIDSSCDCLTV